MKKTLVFILMIFCSVSSFAQTKSMEMNNADKRRREFIEDFLRTYVSAYEKKQVDYISQFFSTNALIITETKELAKCGDEMVPNTTKKRPYKLIVEDKNEYIKRLKEVFAKNRKIKLSMAGKKIVAHSQYPEIYGVAFTQMWMSDGNDSNNLESQMPGYIFLMIDFKKNEMRPTIHVRTWQPKDNIKKPQDKYNLYDFIIYDF